MGSSLFNYAQWHIYMLHFVSSQIGVEFGLSHYLWFLDYMNNIVLGHMIISYFF